jgi:hypothetical protein
VGEEGVSDPTPRESWTPPGDRRRVTIGLSLGYFVGAVAAGLGVYALSRDVLGSLLAFGIVLAAVFLGLWLGRRVADWYTELMNRPWGGAPPRKFPDAKRRGDTDD